MDEKTFARIVRRGIAALPTSAKMAMENVAVVVEKEARRRKAEEAGIVAGEVLLGLYEGVPKTKRGAGYFGVPPDKITIFQKPMEELGNKNSKEIQKLVREVVWHEVGHHLGFSEREIRVLERRKRNHAHAMPVSPKDARSSAHSPTARKTRPSPKKERDREKVLGRLAQW